MSLNDFRRLAAKIDQHMQQLAAEGVREPDAIMTRMMGYVPELHNIWVGASDQQLITLSRDFPGFYRFAWIMEEASEAERRKASRPYDGTPKFSEQHKQMGSKLLTTAATLERGFQSYRASGNLPVFKPQLDELARLYQQWLSDLAAFKASLRAQGVEPRVLENVNHAFDQMAERIQRLALPHHGAGWPLPASLGVRSVKSVIAVVPVR